MNKKILLSVTGCLLFIAAFCQKPDYRAQRKEDRKKQIADLIKKQEEGALVFDRQTVFSGKLYTDGWAAGFEHGKYKTITSTNLWWLELGERKSKKEEKYANSDGFFVGNPFIYGKQNNFYFFKLGFGQQHLIGGKGTKNGVAVSAVYGGGISLGLLKPYYISVVDSADNVKDITYAQDSAAFLNGPIVGGVSFTKGFGDIKVTPGLHAKAGLRFDYGKFNDLVSALEVGLNAEYYTKEMPIMVNSDAKKFFYNAYVAIEFGSRR